VRNWNTYIPKFEYCTDNGAMIAMTGWIKYQAGEFADQSVSPVARWAIGDVTPKKTDQPGDGVTA
jgi:N6-L-threonylcarbamoyladenine synthase